MWLPLDCTALSTLTVISEPFVYMFFNEVWAFMLNVDVCFIFLSSNVLVYRTEIATYDTTDNSSTSRLDTCKVEPLFDPNQRTEIKLTAIKLRMACRKTNYPKANAVVYYKMETRDTRPIIGTKRLARVAPDRHISSCSVSITLPGLFARDLSHSSNDADPHALPKEMGAFD